jgi:peptide chain release factor 1
VNSKKYDSVSLYRIRKLLSDLSDKTGRGTELVTLYLPPKKPVHEAISALREESGTASNIKSDTTRAHVQDALTKVMQRLRLYKNTPENGLVIFCGAIPGPGGPGHETIELYEVIPNKPVSTYLYRCLAPETKILLQNGLHKTIGEIESSWRDVSVKSSNNSGNGTVGSRIKEYIRTRAGVRKVYRITVESGRSIVATEDHPFFTPKGWRNAGDIRSGDLLCVYPTDDLETDSHQEKRNRATLVDESTLGRLAGETRNIERAIKMLKKRDLLPLMGDSPKLQIIARIFGRLFSDRSFTANVENKSNESHSCFTIDVCLGDEEESEQEIRSDLAALGVRAVSSTRSTHSVNTNGRDYLTSVLHIRVRDTALLTLFRALCAPVGSMVVNQGTKIPDWITDSSREVQREFLASYMGGDGEAPRILKSNATTGLRLTFHRVESMHEKAVLYADKIAAMFANLGVKVDAITSSPGYNNKKKEKDGSRTFEYEISFSPSEENALRICHGIGYRYCKRKSDAAALIGEYLRIKEFQRHVAEAKLAIDEEKKFGSNTIVGALQLQLSSKAARTWADGRITHPLLGAGTVPEFSKWLSFSRVSPNEFFLWEQVVSLEEVENQEDVRDLTVESEDHTFIANGFLVHNCDDHFHLEPLREMLREENVIGVLALDSTEAGLGIVSGDNWEVVENVTSGVSGKTRKGGQSARRYERLREMELTDYFNRLADHAKKVFLEQYTVKGLIVSGPGPTKDEFVKDRYLDYRLQNGIIGILDTGYSGREGVRETIEKAGNLLENVRVIEEKKMVQRFLRELNSDSGLAIYGINDVLAALKKAAVETILVNDDVDTIYIKVTCRRCSNVREKFIPRSQYVQEKQALLSTPCPNCGSNEFDVSEKDIVDYLADISIDSGANVEVISSRTEDGAMLKNFGGVSALLRYRS